MKMPSTRGLQRILCATDLSARSTAALQRAGSLARQTGARLTLLHVIDTRQPERVARMQANRAYVELLSQADRAFGSAAGFIDVAVRRGNVLEIIATSAREWDADLIVVAAPEVASTRIDCWHDSRAPSSNGETAGTCSAPRGARWLSGCGNRRRLVQRIVADDSDSRPSGRAGAGVNDCRPCRSPVIRRHDENGRPR